MSLPTNKRNRAVIITNEMMNKYKHSRRAIISGTQGTLAQVSLERSTNYDELLPTERISYYIYIYIYNRQKTQDTNNCPK